MAFSTYQQKVLHDWPLGCASWQIGQEGQQDRERAIEHQY
jgi:hypothetical protein